MTVGNPLAVPLTVVAVLHVPRLSVVAEKAIKPDSVKSPAVLVAAFNLE